MRIGVRRRSDWAGRHMDVSGMPPPKRRALAVERVSQNAVSLTQNDLRYIQSQEHRNASLAETRLFVGDATLPVSRNPLSQSARVGAGSDRGLITRDPLMHEAPPRQGPRGLRGRERYESTLLDPPDDRHQ